MMAQLQHGHCTARSTVLAAPPAMVKDKSGEGGQTAVGLDPINEGVQPDVLQRGRAGMARQRSKSQDVRTATWLLLKENWLKGSKQVCKMTKGPPQHKETWWWNRDVEKVVAKRKVCHKAWRKSKSAEDKHTLDVAKKEVYTAVMTAQESKLQEFTADLQSESGRKNCFRIARQMAREGRDVISVCCMNNDAGNIVSDADGMKNIWRKYML